MKIKKTKNTEPDKNFAVSYKKGVKEGHIQKDTQLKATKLKFLLKATNDS